MNFVEICADWDATMVSEGANPTTRRNYLAHVRATAVSIATARAITLEELTLEEWTTPALRAALAAYRTRPDARFSEPPRSERSPASLRIRLSALRSFTQFCLNESYLETDPLARVRPPALKPVEATTLSGTELLAIREAAASHPRSALVIELMLELGCSIGELAAAELTDYESSGTLTLRGKRSTPRVLALSSTQVDLMTDWLATRTAWLDSSELTSVRLLITRSGTQITSDGLGSSIKRVLAQAGCEEVSSHDLRVSYAQRALEAGASPGLVRQVLGLDSLTALRHMMPSASGVLTPPRTS